MNCRIQKITDFQAEELHIYARLNEAQLYHYREPKMGIFIAESPKVIHRALDAGYRPISFLAEEKMYATEAASVAERLSEDVPLYTADFEILSKITGFQLTRGALCAMERKPLPSVKELCKDAKRVAVMEDVDNPTNIGAIFRAAAALGVDCVLLTKTCSDPLYRRAARVSMGTVFQVPWTYLDGVEDLPEDFRTVAMALREDSVDITDESIKKEDRLAILLGSEGNGLRPETIDGADYVVKIPMDHGVDSLNVAAASAIAFWELARKQ